MNIHKLIKKSSFWRLSLTIFLSVSAIFGLAYVVYSQSGTTIGVNIATNDLLVAGNATTTGNQVVSGNLNVHGAFSPDSFTFNPAGIFTVNGTSTFSTTSFLGDVNFNLKQIKNVVLEKLSNFPSSPVEGQIFWSTATSTPYWYDASNTRWRTQKHEATIVVAASNSKDKEKADYICDGTGDQVEIQAAINAVELLPRSGKVQLLEGTYTVSNSIVLGSLTTLSGTGMFNTVITSGAMANPIIVNKTTANPGNTSITIKDMSIDGTNLSTHTIKFIYSQYFTIDNVQITSAGTSYGLYTRLIEADAVPVDTAWIRHSRFIGNGINGRLAYFYCLDNEFILGSVGLYLIEITAYARIEGNSFEAQTVQGMYIYKPTDMSIINNQFHCGAAGNVQQGIYLLYAKRINIIGNTFGALSFGLGKEAIYMDGGNEDIIISNNTFYGVGQATNNTYYPIYAVSSGSDTRVTIIGNIINAGVGANKMKRGIFIGNGASNFIVKNNTITGGVSGAISYGSITTSIIKDNIGYITENSGTATISSGNTSATVSHGLSAQPATSTIAVVPTNNLGSANKFWVSNVTATTFQINTDVDPGASTAIFNWQIGSY